MNDPRKLAFMAAIVAALLACSGINVNAPDTGSISTMVAETMQALPIPLATSAPTEQPAPSGIQAAFAGGSLTIPKGLATGVKQEAVPALDEQSGAPWDVAPAYSRLTLQGYPLTDKFFEPMIMIYPAQEYAAMSNGAAISVQRLQTILSSSSPVLANDQLPRLPFANAEQVIGAQPVVIPFKNGSGVRVLAEYAQAIVTINNHDLFYHYEGLTSDGKSYVVAILPVTAPFLAPDSDPSSPVPADGIPFPGIDAADATVFNQYHQDVTNRLGTTPPDSFQPSLTALDDLIRSLQIQP